MAARPLTAVLAAGTVLAAVPAVAADAQGRPVQSVARYQYGDTFSPEFVWARPAQLPAFIVHSAGAASPVDLSALAGVR